MTVHETGPAPVRLRLPLILSAFFLSLSLGCIQPRIPDDAFFFKLPATPAPAAPGLESVELKTEDGARLQGYYLPCEGARAAVLYLGPNHSTAEELLPFLRGYRDRLKVSVMALDFRGYGPSEGTLTMEHLYADADLAQGWLARRTGLPVVLHGFSLGSFAALGAATRHEPQGLILQGTGTTVKEWVRLSTPWYAKPLTRKPIIGPVLANVDQGRMAAGLHGPLLVLAGRKDRSAPWQMGRDLVEASGAARKRFVLAPKAGHSAVMGDGFWEALDQFIGEVLVAGKASLARG